MEKIINDISKNIKKYRKLNKMTQKELAQKVGVSIAAVSNWETGTNSIDIDVLFKVCDALDVPISVMASTTADDFQLAPIEKELIERFRKASPMDQITIIKTLKIPEAHFPTHILRYYDIFRKLMDSDTT